MKGEDIAAYMASFKNVTEAVYEVLKRCGNVCGEEPVHMIFKKFYTEINVSLNFILVNFLKYFPMYLLFTSFKVCFSACWREKWKERNRKREREIFNAWFIFQMVAVCGTGVRRAELPLGLPDGQLEPLLIEHLPFSQAYRGELEQTWSIPDSKQCSDTESDTALQHSAQDIFFSFICRKWFINNHLSERFVKAS